MIKGEKKKPSFDQGRTPRMVPLMPKSPYAPFALNAPTGHKGF